MYKKYTVAFDFDGTIIPSNIGFEFNKWLIQQSLLRTLLAIVALPFICMLIRFPRSSRLGMNVGCYIATAFQTRPLLTLRKQFMTYYFEQHHGTIYKGALLSIRQHQIKGEHVVVISGSQQWLVRGALKHLGIANVKVIGSQQKYFLGGYVLTEHCILHNKLRMAKAANINPEHWKYGYTDSVQDTLMVKYCKDIYMVNPSHNTLRHFRSCYGEKVHANYWMAQDCLSI